MPVSLRIPLSYLFLLTALCSRAVAPVASFTENKGQWPSQVLYRVMLPSGALFVERSAFTYVLKSGGDAHVHGPTDHEHSNTPLKVHAYKVHFVDGEAQGTEPSGRQSHYENFFLGNDPAKWGTGCGVFGEVVLKDVWPGIDLRMDGTKGLKYELIVAPGGDPGMVAFRYEGQDRMELKDGRIVVTTSAGQVFEEAPFTFQDMPKGKRTIESAYRFEKDLVRFDLPAKYDNSRTLTIDPTITFGSYSASTADNFGFTATYDGSGHLYGGGIVFEQGYPTTVGVLDETFNGGTIDAGISKWSPDGSDLVWSTYFGGSGNDSPHSMVVNANDELYVMGATGSSDLPTTPGCVDNTFGGGIPLTLNGSYGYTQPNGTDIYVAHFNSAATALIGSTYIGGPGNDGINNSSVLWHNYGDSFRGEIIMDANENPVIASVTYSNGLPTPGGPQPAISGGQDGYCFRSDPGLNNVLWATYIGGSEDDAAYSVQVDSNGELFVAGGTISVNMPMAPNASQATYSGSVDGFIAHYDLGGNMVGSTYLGTSSYDQCYFVQLNTADEVFVVGQTHGNYPVTPGKYANTGSSQFIHKFDHDLSNSLWSTRFGNGGPAQDISPTAFLVSDCGQIYFSGWGGSVNVGAGNGSSSTANLPTTADAFQSSTDGSDFYLMLLEPEAVGLNYATYFGGNTSAEHVDGGTSRFDKNGTVYQAVCAGCGGNDDFPTTPGAWSNTNNSFNCNLGVFKFDLARGIADIDIDGPNVICLPGTAQFVNNSVGGNSFAWDFGNGSTSTDFEPSAEYLTADTFLVSMILTDTTGCRGPDTASVNVITVLPPNAEVDSVPAICAGLTVQLNATGGGSYNWFPATGLDNTTIADPLLTPLNSGTWTVVVSGQCGTDTAQVTVDLNVPQGSAGPDATICVGDQAMLVADGGGSYTWEPDTTLSNLEIANPTASPSDTTTYFVEITTPEGCTTSDSVVVYVLEGVPTPLLEDTFVCEGGSVGLLAPIADSYAWQNAVGISALDVRNPTVTPEVPTTYIVVATNICGSITDEAFVDVIVPQADAWPDSLVCPGEPVQLGASGGISYEWSPANLLDSAQSRTPNATIYGPIEFSVIAVDEYGCSDIATVLLDTYPMPTIQVGPDQVMDLGDVVQLYALGEGTFHWEPPNGLYCTECPNPLASPEQSTYYVVTMTDTNGCKVNNTVTVLLNGTLFVPNTFTPNGDNFNDLWGAWGSEIKEFQILVFNRWGEQIFKGDDLDARWDGSYNGVLSPIDTYVWRVDLEELAGTKRTVYGHVNLVR